ncbi:MAG: F0F1 ATP synthase subunit B [bacterium]|nr:F0F1 ATP synthase subunit B [bacterium]
MIVPMASETPSGIGLLIPPWYDIIWSAVAIAIIAVPMVMFVLPRVTAMLDERAEKIEGGIQAGEQARAEAAELRARFDDEIAAARREAAGIRDRASEEGKAIVAEARAKAESEGQRIVAAANRQIEADRQAAEISLRSEVGLMASQLASRIVGETLTDGDMQTRVIDRFLSDLEAESPVGIAAEGEK